MYAAARQVASHFGDLLEPVVLPSDVYQTMGSTRRTLLLAAILGMAVAVPAMAQMASVYPAACDASKVSKSDVERAHTVFLSGKGFLDESNYDKAISYFKDAYSIDCSVHAILPIIATAYERKGDKAEAIRALEEYLRRVPTTTDREVIERRIRNLKDQLAQGERPIASAPTPTAGVAPTATATVSASLPTSEPTVVPTVPSPTETTSGAASPPPPGSGHTAAPWVLVGAGGVLLVAGGVILGVGSGKVSTANSQCPTHQNCSTSVASDGNSGRSLETVGLVGGIAGVVAIAGGLVWHFTEHTTATTAQGNTYVSPVVSPSFAGLALGGAF